MPITYNIFPELDLVIYVCVGTITPTEFFKVGDQVLLDPRLKDKTKVILDLFNADLDTSVSDIHLAIFKNKEAQKLGKEVGPTAVYTRSTSLRFLGETLRHLSFETVTNFSIFHNQYDAIQWLGLSEEEVLNAWAELEKQVSSA